MDDFGLQNQEIGQEFEPLTAIVFLPGFKKGIELGIECQIYQDSRLDP